MKTLRVLHITPWFPSPDNEVGGIFIAEHVKALNKHCYNEVLHIRFSNTSEKTTTQWNTITVNRNSMKPLINKWRLKETLAHKAVTSFLKKKHKEFDLINFYIAYPNAINIDRLMKGFPNLQFTIMEQWSAYHQNFGLAENSSGKKRIASIFKNNIPLLTVSKALGEDIRRFSNQPNLPFEVVPNIANTDIFNYQAKEKDTAFIYSSINNWSEMKNPFVLIDAFALALQKDENMRLILAGSGPLIPKMKEHIDLLNLSDKIQLLGRITKEEVAQLLKKSNAYCQSSHYETFSAICVEALTCGTPVIATDIGGMKDFVLPENGILVDEMKAVTWSTAMVRLKENYHDYDSAAIAQNAAKSFNSETVGHAFFTKLNAIAQSHGE